jgi:predicted transcriptional regulator
MSDEKILRVLEDIKKLLILQLISQGKKQREIAEALGVDPAVISRLVTPPKQKKK